MVRTASLFWLSMAFVPLAALAAAPEHVFAAPQTAPTGDKLPAILTAKPLSSSASQRHESGLAQLRARFLEFRAGRGTPDLLLEAARYCLETGLALADKPAAQLALREQFLELAEQIEKLHQERYAAGRIARDDLEKAYDFTLDAGIQLLQAKRKAKSSQSR